jgi:hypothetical protein
VEKNIQLGLKQKVMRLDKNIPPPDKKTTAKRGQSKYPFKSMGVDEHHSFIVPDGKRHSVATLAKKFGESCDPVRRFTIRPDDKGKLRCWRIQ